MLQLDLIAAAGHLPLPVPHDNAENRINMIFIVP